MEEQWKSKIKYLKKQTLEDIDLEEYIVHFKANGELLNKRKWSTSSTVRQSAIPAGRRPVWGALEIRLTEWIKEMHGLRKSVKCGIARWFDFPLSDQERASETNVEQQLTEEACEDVEEITSIKK